MLILQLILLYDDSHSSFLTSYTLVNILLTRKTCFFCNCYVKVLFLFRQPYLIQILLKICKIWLLMAKFEASSWDHGFVNSVKVIKESLLQYCIRVCRWNQGDILCHIFWGIKSYDREANHRMLPILFDTNFWTVWSWVSLYKYYIDSFFTMSLVLFNYLIRNWTWFLSL